MTDDTLALGIPQILTRARLARSIALPLLAGLGGATLALVAVLTQSGPIGAAAIIYAGAAILLARPDESRLRTAVTAADERLRSFLGSRTDVRQSRLSSLFLREVNPLETAEGWPTIVALAGLPRGAWTLFALPGILAALAFITGTAVLVLPAGAALGGSILAVAAVLAVLLALDAYAAVTRTALCSHAPEASDGMRDVLASLAGLEAAMAAIDAERGLPPTGSSPELR